MRSRSRSTAGFTLLEVMVVCAIAALVSAIALPRLGFVGDREVTLAARRLADDLTLARDRAVLRGRRAIVWLDLDAQRWRAGDADEGVLPAGIRIAAVRTPDAQVTTGRARWTLHPAGDALPAAIDLIDAHGHGARVWLPPARARAVVQPRERS